jgi:hypothetical protein
MRLTDQNSETTTPLDTSFTSHFALHDNASCAFTLAYRETKGCGEGGLCSYSILEGVLSASNRQVHGATIRPGNIET